jgi:hypothetical protein
MGSADYNTPPLKLGQVESLVALECKVDEFKALLNHHGITINRESDLQRLCDAIVTVVGKHLSPELRDPSEDIRTVFADVVGFWLFLGKILRLQTHPEFNQIVPHLRLLNNASIAQTKALVFSNDASNKVLELLFALVMLDIGSDLILDDPNHSKGKNPDILVTIQNRRWGFECKSLTGRSGKAFFDNLKKGVNQVQDSQAEIGCVVIGFRNLLDHSQYWPIMNEEQYRAGAEPVFGAFTEPDQTVGLALFEQVKLKQLQVLEEIGADNVLRIFEGKKALPGFLAFCQTATGTASAAGPIPTSIAILALANFNRADAVMSVFHEMNLALHERKHIVNANQ